MSLINPTPYITVTDASTYLKGRVGAEDWFDLADASDDDSVVSKDSMLKQSYVWLRSLSDFSLPDSSDDEKLQVANAEAALHLIRYGEDREDYGALLSSGVDIITQGDRRASLQGEVSVPEIIADLLSGYLPGGNFVDLEV